MNEQLLLLRPDERPWRLDEHTRQVGRQGVQEARAALRQAAPGTGPTSPAGPAGPAGPASAARLARRRLADRRISRPTAA